MMNEKTRHITIALAGIFQASALVKQWAHQGQVDEKAYIACIQSLVELNPANMHAIYTDLSDLRIGFQSLIDFFSQPSRQRDKEIASYFVGLLILQNKLKKEPAMLKNIQDRIPFLATQIQHFGIEHPTVTANIADIYTQTLSQMKYRIHVHGNRQYLEQEAGINKIRALLLAGVRAAVLWQQMGGKLYQLFFFRQRFINAAKELLQETRTPHE